MNSSDSFTNLEFRIYDFVEWIYTVIDFSTEKKNLFWTNKKFVYLIFIPKYCDIIPK